MSIHNRQKPEITQMSFGIMNVYMNCGTSTQWNIAEQ